MSQEYIEVSEKTLDDAITSACQKLAVTSDRLDYIVVSHGSSGFLGFGGKPAVIKARVKEAAEATEAVLRDVLGKVNEKTAGAEKSPSRTEQPRKQGGASQSAQSGEHQPEPWRKNATPQSAQSAGRQAEPWKKSDASQSAQSAERLTEPWKKNAASQSAQSGERQEEPWKQNAVSQTNGIQETEAAEAAPQASEAERAPYGRRSDFKERGGRYGRGYGYHGEDGESARPARAGRGAHSAQEISRIAPERQLSDEAAAQVQRQAQDFLTEVFRAMKMEVAIKTSFVKEYNLLSVDLTGDDMGILIGKRGQTLDSLQYLISLVVNKGTDGYVHVKADTENYRERRKQTLENLARNIAYKVKRTKQPVALEPMNPYERRIIHSALQSDRYVTTYSEGEEPFRKVVVTLKK